MRGAMPSRRARYSTDQTAIDFDAPAPEPVETISVDAAADTQPGYSIKTGWIDTADRTRTWVLLNPHGTQLAEITTKRGVQKFADLLNRLTCDGQER